KLHAKTRNTATAMATTSHCPVLWPAPNHWKSAGRLRTNSPLRAQLSDSRRITQVAKVTTIDGKFRPATSAPLTATSPAPASKAAPAAQGTGPPAAAPGPASAHHTATV